jgi:hypothetical protein
MEEHQVSLCLYVLYFLTAMINLQEKERQKYKTGEPGLFTPSESPQDNSIDSLQSLLSSLFENHDNNNSHDHAHVEVNADTNDHHQSQLAPNKRFITSLPPSKLGKLCYMILTHSLQTLMINKTTLLTMINS